MTMITQSEPFDINVFLKERAVNRLTPVHRANRRDTGEYEFSEIVKMVNTFFQEKPESGEMSDRDIEELQHIQHQATLGDEESMNMLIDEISSFLRKNDLLHVPFESMYSSLAHALFEEIYRFKRFYKWTLFPSSPSAKIVGKEIWFKIKGKFVKQQEELDSADDVYEFIRLFQQGNSNFRINEQNPQGELDLADGTRVTLTIPPRTLLPTIVFRRFIVDRFSFEEQAKRETIATEDIKLFGLLSSVLLNIVIAGHVESGKSTMLKTFYAERPKDLVALLIEDHPESYLKRDFPDRLVHEFSIGDSNIQKVSRTILRFDHDYVIFQEVRGAEADAAIDGASRGSTGLLMTYHITDPSKVPEQLAQHIIDIYPNRRNTNEVRRVAQTLHLGLTMENVGENIKKVTSLYEICYDYDTDSAWINYLIRYNPQTKEWEYNAELSESLLTHLRNQNEDVPEAVVNHLLSQQAVSPMQVNPIQPILFKEEGR